MKVVVIGGVAGGPSFATRFRRLNEDAEIVMFERGEFISYASCALPYYLGGVITDRDSLIERTPETLKQKNNIDVRVNTEVTSIDPDKKVLAVKDLTNNRNYEESYDKLVIATGARPVLPPIKGLKKASHAFTLRSMGDGDKIKSFMDDTHPQSVAVLGAGAAGVELAESFRHLGLKVYLIDQAPRIMMPLDHEMAGFLQDEIKQNDIDLRLESTVTEVSDDGQSLLFKDGTSLSVDMLIVVTGVQPNNELATDAGIGMAEDGHIDVDEQFQTCIEDIYAIGDVIETTSLINGFPVPSMLSSAANRQGHLLADIINGAALTYPGFIGVSVAKVFDLTVSTVGFTETALKQLGVKNYDYVLITPFDHAFFYPDANRLNIKLIFEKDTGKILGGQFVGHEGVDKGAGELSTAIAGGLSVRALPNLELPYSPPYSSTRDPLNVAGYVAINRLSQLSNTVRLASLTTEDRKNGFFLDIREPGKPKAGTINADINIPLSQLRTRLLDLPADKTIYIIYRKGLGPYNATRILSGNNFKVKIVEE